MILTNLFHGILSEITVIISVLFLHYTLPGEVTTGYCCNNQFQPLIYKLNGLSILLTITALFLILPTHLQTYYANHYFENLFGANIIGLLASFYLLHRGGNEKYSRCITIDQISSNSSKIKIETQKFTLLQKFYFGCEWNPRFFNIDSKMILYTIGAVHLQLNLLSFVAKEYYETQTISLAMTLYVFLFTIFLYDYMFYEKIHLYTYDLFAEKLGFKLTWGCLVFYPFFYCIGVHSLISSSISPRRVMTILHTLLTVVVYLLGWFFTRGANLQKYYFKLYPNESYCFFNLIEQKSFPESNNRILCSGFWGIARHVNYFGEILQSIALTLPGLIIHWPIMIHLDSIPSIVALSILYPIYYILLFISRQIDDDKVCRVKYGEVWDRYCQQVRWRIFPGIW